MKMSLASQRRTAIMRFRRYLKGGLLVGAGAAMIGVAPAVVATPAPPQPAGIDTAPLAVSNHGGSYCGDFCGTYIGYGNHRGVAAIPASPWSPAFEH
jgi:hypothetical protein